MMTAPKEIRRRQGDDGVVLILIAALLVGVLMIVALVVDFSNVRNSRQNNKLIADVVATAGLSSLAPDGISHPWAGACSALNFLRANQSGVTVVAYTDGAGNSVSDPCSSRLSHECVPGDLSTFAWIQAVAGGEPIDIKAGYETPDPAFPEDQTIYAGDDSLSGGCDQLAVIISRSDGALFGGIADQTSYASVSRTVGRVRIEPDGKAAPAFLMLERKNCAALWEQTGAQTAIPSKGLRVLAPPDDPSQPGIIHVDSAGTGAGCNKTGPCNKGNYAVSSADSSYPKIVAEDSPTGVTGIVAIRASDPLVNGAAACQVPPSHGVWPAPRKGAVVSRAPIDEKYNTAPATISDLHGPAQLDANRTVAPAGWTQVDDCGSSVPVLAQTSATQVFINCPSGFSPSNVTFAVATDVIFNGKVSIGSGASLFLPSATRVVVGGASNDSALKVSSGGRFGINSSTSFLDQATTFGACDSRDGPGASPPGTWGATAKLIIFGGSGINKPALDIPNGMAALCQTFVYLAGPKTQASYVQHVSTDGTYHPSCTATLPCPATTGPDGAGFSVSGNAAFVRWSAPNQLATQPAPGAAGVEDLALWTESPSSSSVSGNGQMLTNGVFFLPNVDVEISAPSLPSPRDAQFISRTLGLTQGFFQMQPVAANVTLVPALAGLGLVR